jgi:hypothetical protein
MRTALSPLAQGASLLTTAKVWNFFAFDQFVALTINYYAHRRFLCRAPLINLYSSLTKEYGEHGIV